ncbi:MAG: response regulator [Desulfovibrionaceae bacterium]
MMEKLLLVDDEEGIRKFLGLFLKDLGYEVLTAENGAKALEIMERFRPTIVLTDIKMPGMDGVELLRRIKERRPDTEVVMITGHGDMDMAVKSLKLEAADFITKPINDEILEAALGRVREKIILKRQLARYTEHLEDLVREKTALHQQLFDESPCYISVVDRQFALTSANRQFKATFGECAASLCYRSYTDRPEPCPNCPTVKTFADGGTHQTESILGDATGKPRNVLIRTAPIRNLAGEITHAMELGADITELRKLQDNLASLGLMIGSMSHGIKGMLTALDGGIYRLESGIKRNAPDRVAQGFETVKEVSARIRGMVLDMLYYVKDRPLEWAEKDVAAFAAKVAAMVEPKATANGVAFHFAVNGDAGAFEIDEAAFSSALVNILENAVDACCAGGGSGGRVDFMVEPLPDSVRCTVRDNGAGMDAETREKMFTLFFSSKGKKGTGLGLFISNRVIEQHCGGITVASEPGQGTCFTITVPRTLPDSVKIQPVDRD